MTNTASALSSNGLERGGKQPEMRGLSSAVCVPSPRDGEPLSLLLLQIAATAMKRCMQRFKTWVVFVCDLWLHLIQHVTCHVTHHWDDRKFSLSSSMLMAMTVTGCYVSVLAVSTSIVANTTFMCRSSDRWVSHSHALQCAGSTRHVTCVTLSDAARLTPARARSINTWLKLSNTDLLPFNRQVLVVLFTAV